MGHFIDRIRKLSESVRIVREWSQTIYDIELFLFCVVGLGLVLCAIHAWQRELYLYAFCILFLPFCCFLYILEKMEEGIFKKIVAFLVLGGSAAVSVVFAVSFRLMMIELSKV